jgi:hypothetical protein
MYIPKATAADAIGGWTDPAMILVASMFDPGTPWTIFEDDPGEGRLTPCDASLNVSRLLSFDE